MKITSLFHGINENRRYVLTAILLVLLIVFGSHVNDNEKLKDDQITDLKNYYVLPDSAVDMDSYSADGAINAIPGEYYRLEVDLRGLYGPETTTEIQNEIVTMNVISTSVSGTKYKLGTLDFNLDSSLVRKEIVFQATDYLRDIEIVKTDNSKSFILLAKNFKVSRLNIQNLNEGNALKASVFGFPNSESTVSILDSKLASDPYTFHGEKSLIGQIFKNDNMEYMSGVEFKMHFLGNGGFGNYQLVLRQAEKQSDGSYKVGNVNLAKFSFNTVLAEKVFQNYKKDNFYWLPLASRLSPNSYYFIGVSNSSVNYNLTNKLRLYGSKATMADDGASVSISNSNKTTSLPGSLYLKVMGSKLPGQNQENILFGSSIEDIGGGVGLFNYDKSKTYLTSLDHKNIDWNKTTYSFNTIYPFASIFISGALNKLTDEILYSFDGNNWQQVEDSAIDSKGDFQAEIKTEANQSKMFLMVKYPGDTIKKEDTIQPDFLSLKLSAALKISEKK